MRKVLNGTSCLAALLIAHALAVAATEDLSYITLENGLDVIVIENATVPLVTIEIDVRNGAFTEPPEFDGLSHFFEHMFFKANAAIPNQERFLERTRELGMSFNATTSEERVNYSFTVLKHNLRPGMAFMKAAITSPLFLPEEMERERLVVIDEYDRNESDPMFQLMHAVNRKLWHQYFSRKNVIGDREVILTATPEKMRIIQEKYYIPNNAALLVAGAVEHEEVFAFAKEFFNDWQRGPDPFPDNLLADDGIPDHPGLNEDAYVVVEQPVNAVTIMMAWQGPSVSIHTSTTYAADVFNFIMNQNSKFPSILLGSGLFSSINFTYYTLDRKGLITIVASTTAEKFLRAQTALLEEMKFLDHPDYYTDEQIDFAKSNLEAHRKYEWERPSEYIQSVGFWWSVTGSLDYYLNYVDNIKKVKREEISSFVKKYMQNAPHVMGILVSPEDRRQLKL